MMGLTVWGVDSIESEWTGLAGKVVEGVGGRLEVVGPLAILRRGRMAPLIFFFLIKNSDV